MAKLDILDEIERKADGYLVLNVLLNIAVQITSIYLIDQILTYALRLVSNPC